MKKWLAVFLCLVMLLFVFPSCNESQNAAPPEDLKILCIGNSFSEDTVEYVADIALDLGVQSVTVANLYYGGCSINKHYYHAQNDLAVYDFNVNTGNGWTLTPSQSISSAIKSQDWDWISIQHGTADGSRYAEKESYENLPALVEYVRGIAGEDTKIAFNMTWVGEKNSHEEMISFKNNQLNYFEAIAALTQETVVPTPGIDLVSPTGTAIQNARTADVIRLTRDKYHLSKDLGRYIAGLAFFKALTGLDIAGITWAPEGVDDYEKQVAIEAATNAVTTPFAVTGTAIDKASFEDPAEE